MPHDTQSLADTPHPALSERYGAAMAHPPAWNAVLATMLEHRSVRSFLPQELAPG